MAGQETAGHPDGEVETRQAVRRRVLQVGILLLVLAALLFLAAGRLDWTMAWVYLGLLVGMMVLNALFVDRELIAERSRIGEGTKDWDRVLGSLSILLGIPIVLLISGLDERFSWSHANLLLQILAAAVVAGAWALSVWAMAANKFFSSTVRIQKERGHTVVSTGPYSFVRHPGYLSYALLALATPFMLSSLWALIPGLLGIAAVVVRTALEDRTLAAELPGYQEYAAHVRYRLFPGIW